MTAIPAPTLATHDSAHEPGHEHEQLSFIKRYFFSTDHKIIGIEFLFLGLSFFIVGGLLAMLVRWQLAYPGRALPAWLAGILGWEKPVMTPDFYNQAFTMHATLMIFFVIIPILVGAFGNYLIPLMIGAKDMAFPFLNGMAFWAALPAGAIMVAAFFLPGGSADAGWTSYPPLSSLHASGVSYQGHMPYRGYVPLIEPQADSSIPSEHRRDAKFAFGKFTYLLRLHSQGIHTAAVPTPIAGGVEAAFAGNNDDVLEAARNALIDKGYLLQPAADENVVVGESIPMAGQETRHVKIVVTDNKLTIESGSGASELFDRIKSELNWQSAWPAVSLLTTGFALLLSYLYICAYYVRLGSRPLNWLVGLVLSAVGAYFTLKGVQYIVFDGQSAWFFSLFILGFSSIVGAVNYLATVVKMRCPGMTMFRMPLSVWALFITAVMVLLATPVLAAVLLLNLLDHHRLTSFFIPYNWTTGNALQSPSGGGYPLLHQHLFWFYSHPAVYIMILPAMGMVSDILSVNSRKPVFGYRPMVYALSAIAFLGFIVWAHHMFQSGLNPTLATSFAISTMFIAVPSAIKTFNWMGTMWGGNIRYTCANLNAIAFVSMFVIGGMSGIYMASTAVDVHIRGTYFIVAHIHYVLFGASMFGIFGALYHWYPKMFGRMMSEKLGKVHFWLSFIAFNLTFFPMHMLGLHGAPRRVFEFVGDPSYHTMNVFITHSAFLLGGAQILLVINFIGSWFFGKRPGNNPWQATTLEWETPSPPPHGNFPQPPVVFHGPYEYASPLVEEDYLLQTRYVEAAPEVS